MQRRNASSSSSSLNSMVASIWMTAFALALMMHSCAADSYQYVGCYEGYLESSGRFAPFTTSTFNARSPPTQYIKYCHDSCLTKHPNTKFFGVENAAQGEGGCFCTPSSDMSKGRKVSDDNCHLIGAQSCSSENPDDRCGDHVNFGSSSNVQVVAVYSITSIPSTTAAPTTSSATTAAPTTAAPTTAAPATAGSRTLIIVGPGMTTATPTTVSPTTAAPTTAAPKTAIVSGVVGPVMTTSAPAPAQNKPCKRFVGPNNPNGPTGCTGENHESKVNNPYGPSNGYGPDNKSGPNGKSGPDNHYGPNGKVGKTGENHKTGKYVAPR